MNKKDQIIEKLKENGCRITKQRLMLIDIIYKASKADHRIGVATVYRMINALEDIGAISRKNMYKVECSDNCGSQGGCEIILDDNTICHLSPGNWNKVVREGMRRCGYLKNQKIAKIEVQK